MSKKIIALSLTIIFLDRLFKFLAVSGYFSPPVSLIGGLFSLYFTSNFKIAFSLPVEGKFLQMIILLIIIGLVFYLIRLYQNKAYKKADYLIIVLFGAVSNFFDRISYGYVIDYFTVRYFMVFNLADMMIVVGLIGIFWQFQQNKLQKN